MGPPRMVTKVNLKGRDMVAMVKRTLAVFGTCVVLSGCQAAMYGTAEDLNRIRVGMTRAEVIAALGEPMTTGADAALGEDRLIYKRMAYTLGWSPKLYEV